MALLRTGVCVYVLIENKIYGMVVHNNSTSNQHRCSEKVQWNFVGNYHFSVISINLFDFAPEFHDIFRKISNYKSHIQPQNRTQSM